MLRYYSFLQTKKDTKYAPTPFWLIRPHGLGTKSGGSGPTARIGYSSMLSVHDRSVSIVVFSINSTPCCTRIKVAGSRPVSKNVPAMALFGGGVAASRSGVVADGVGRAAAVAIRRLLARLRTPDANAISAVALALALVLASAVLAGALLAGALLVSAAGASDDDVSSAAAESSAELSSSRLDAGSAAAAEAEGSTRTRSVRASSRGT